MKYKQEDGGLDLDGREVLRDYGCRFGGRVGRARLMMDWM